MKKISLILISMIIGLFGVCQTLIPPGPVSGLWTYANSPYLITGETSILDGTTLEIEPGVRIEWQDNYAMIVNGQILAIGTESDSIIFIAGKKEKGFGSIRFDDTPTTNDSSKFIYCQFKYGKVFGDAPDNSGGAIAIRYFDKLLVEHCLFDQNQAMDYIDLMPGGGAIAIWTSSPVLRNNTFTNNQAYLGGAVLCYEYSNPIIESNLFNNNSAIRDGGAIEIFNYCDPLILNNTIVYNTAENVGGGIDVFTDCNPEIRNTILWSNTALEGDQVYVFDEESNPDFYYSDIQGGDSQIGGVGVNGEYFLCIDDNPQFVDALSGDFHLSEDSPCIDTGDPDLIDPDGSGSDIGAFYYDQTVGVKGFKPHASGFRLEIYPVPAGDCININFQSPTFSFQIISAEINIINNQGIVVLKQFITTNQTTRLDLSPLPAGIYILKVRLGNEIATRKIIRR